MNKVKYKLPNLYLDIDGVIFPFPSSPDRRYENHLFENADKKSNHSLEMIRRLGNLSMNLVWCTTRSERVIPLIVDEIDGLRDGRQLPLIPRRRAPTWIKGLLNTLRFNQQDSVNTNTSIGLKLEAIVRDQRKDPTPFVWIDDDITDLERSIISDRFSDRPHLVVPTDKELGLDLPQLIRVEEFDHEYGKLD